MLKQLKKYGLKIMLIGIFSIFISCNPSQFELPAHQATLLLPLLDVKLGLSDLLLADTSDILQEDSTGLVSLVYSTSASSTFEEMFICEDVDMDFTIPGIPADFPDFEIEIPINSTIIEIDTGFYEVFEPKVYNIETEIEIKEFIFAEFISGILALEITNNMSIALNAGAQLQIINKGETEPLIEFNLNTDMIPGTLVVLEDVNLANLTLRGSFTFKIVNLYTPGGTNITINHEDILDVKISLSNMALRKASFATIDFDLPSVKLDVLLDFPYGSLIRNAKLDDGDFTIEVPELYSPLTLNITFLSITQNDSILNVQLGEGNTNISFENMSVDLSSIPPGYNALPIELQLAINDTVGVVEIEFEKDLPGVMTLSNLDYNYLSGYLGKSTSLFEEQSEPDFFERIVSGSLVFDDPQINIYIKNGVGTAVTMQDDGDGLYIRGKNERLYGDQSIEIGQAMEDFTIESAPFQGDHTLSVLELNKTTEPNLNEFFTLFPSYIDMRIPMILGTSNQDFNQFIEDVSSIEVTVDIELPLNLSADRFIITDTSTLSLLLDPEKYQVKSGIFTAYVISDYPIELLFQSYFLDSNKEVIDSLFDSAKVIEAAEVDENGEILEPFVSEFSIEFNKEQIEKLGSTMYGATVMYMQTPNGDFVKLLSPYKLDYKLTGEIVTDIDLN